MLLDYERFGQGGKEICVAYTDYLRRYAYGADASCAILPKLRTNGKTLIRLCQWHTTAGSSVRMCPGRRSSAYDGFKNESYRRWQSLKCECGVIELREHD